MKKREPTPKPAPQERPVWIHDAYITLGQAIKIAGWIDTGGAAKEFLASEALWVNGEPENRRGKKLRPGDRVAWQHRVLCIQQGASPEEEETDEETEA